MVAAVAATAAALLGCTPQPGAGHVAYVAAGALRVLDLETCRTRTLVARDAVGPVRFSHDGRWVGFGNGRIVPTAGGRVRRPLGAVERWAWSPRTDDLVGLTARGAVVEGRADGGAPPLLREPAGWGARSVAWSPDGLSYAVGRAKFAGAPSPKGLQQIVLFYAGGGATVVYRTPKGRLEPPDVVGFAPYAHGYLLAFQPDRLSSASIAMDGLPLVPLNTGSGLPLPEIVHAMLPIPGFFAPCGRRLLVVAGAGRDTTTNKRVLLATFDPGAERWRLADLGRDRRRAWVSPACSPDAASAAIAAGPDSRVTTAAPVRAIWLLSLDGRTRRRLTDPPAGRSDESPAWTANGKAVLFVRQRREQGSLYLVRLDGRLVGPLARVRGAAGTVGYADWPVDAGP